MSQPAISVRNLGKCYRLGEALSHDTLRDQIVHGVRRLFQPKIENQKSKNAKEESFWALKNLSFDVQPGEVVGIIGRNGAGKSTLLKVLSQITEPTEGEVRIRGRVASLLEVGTGFHQELTGRENVFLNGAILGMSKTEIKRKFDEIVDFSGVEKFLDTPVKRYSSGMYVRLAFAVAAHLEPEILIVDEVLAVGDAQFQKKCLGKMKDVAGHGRTVLFVSHNMTVISSLCGRSLLLDGGRKRNEGPTQDVIFSYINEMGTGNGEVSWGESDPAANSEGRLRLLHARILCDNEVTANVVLEKPTVVQYEFEALRDDLNICTSIHLMDRNGTCVLASGTQPKILPRGRYRHSCVFPAHFLNDGIYFIAIILVTESTNFEVIIRDAISFNAHESAKREDYMGKIIGCVRPHLDWEETAITSDGCEIKRLS